MLSIPLPSCASPLCTLPCLKLGKQKDENHSLWQVSEGLLLPTPCLQGSAVPLQHPTPGCKHLLPRSLGASYTCGFGHGPAMLVRNSPVSHGAQSHSRGRGQTWSMGWEAAVPQGCGMGASLQPVLVLPSTISPHHPPIPYFGPPNSFPPCHTSSRLAGVTEPPSPCRWWE